MSRQPQAPRPSTALHAALATFIALSLATTALAAALHVREAAYRIEAMACSSCAERIQAVLSKRRGVSSVNVVFRDELAIVRFDPSIASSESIRMAIDALGYSATLLPFYFRPAVAGLELKRGTTVTAELVLGIGPEDAYVHPDAPLKLKIAGDAITLAQTTLSRADARETPTDKAKLLTFPVTLSVDTVGERTLNADLSFFYCTPAACTKKTASARIAISVIKPDDTATAAHEVKPASNPEANR